MGVWTIEIGGISRKYKDTDFESRLDKSRPITFSATVEYSADIDYFDLIEIKRDDVVEWKGFLENKSLEWDGSGQYLSIGGRDTTVIAWKKWSESFSNLHEDTKGFFGQVSAVELIKFLLRNPTSDLPNEFPLNKEGWGMDQTRLGDFSAQRTSLGDPNWTKLRRRGYGWRNKGTQFNSDSPDVDANITHAWNDVGASPWISTDNTAVYIWSNTPEETDVFSFADLGGTASGINDASLTIKWKPQVSWWAWDKCRCEIFLSPDGGTNYFYVGAVSGWTYALSADTWKTFTWNVNHILTTVTEVNNARVKFVNKQNYKTYICWCYLGINYSTDGTQETDDCFDIPFDYDEIMGIYVESRFDDDSYPINYRMYKVTNIVANYNHASWSETDPNNHITIDSNTELSFDAYMDETAYHVLDGGADFFGLYFKHTLKSIINTNPVPEPAAGGVAEGIILGLWGVTNVLDDLYSLIGATEDFIALTVWKDPNDVIAGGAPIFLLVESDGGALNTTGSPELDETKTYEFKIKRNEDSIIVEITEDGAVFSTLSLTLNAPSHTFRYLFGCVTSSSGDADNCDVDIYDLVTEVETALIDEVTNNTFRDIIHSWEPQEISMIRIRITTRSDKEWAISQVYVYPSVDFALRTYRDTIITTLLTGNAASGQKVVSVTNADSYNIGDIVTIKDDDGQEVNQVDSKAVLDITMVNNLENSYATADNAELIKGLPTEQYIRAFSFDSIYTTPIGPLNLPRARLIDQINIIMEKCQVLYVPYEWWLALDNTNTFHMKDQRGTDLSADITFIKGVNMGGSTKTGRMENTVQRLKVLGEGEGKRQEMAGSNWAESKTNMVNINTFIEEVISDKSVVDFDIAEIIANVKVTEQAPPINQLQVDITNDTYPSMTYTVGDDTTVTDSLTVVSGSHRIFNIKKKVSNNGEQITLFFDFPHKDVNDDWHDLYNRLKTIEIYEATAGDWTGEADKEGEVSAEKVSRVFEQSAKNDTIDKSKGVTDPKWNFYTLPLAASPPNGPASYVPNLRHDEVGGPTPERYTWADLSDITFHHTDDKMGFWGPDHDAGLKTLIIEMGGETYDRIDVHLDKNPKLTSELKFVWADGLSATNWREGDIFEIGMYDITTSIGYFIRFTKQVGNTLLAEAVWNETGSNEETQTIMVVNMSNENASENKRYKMEIIVDTDGKMVFFNIYDLTFTDPPLKYPMSVIKLNIDTTNIVRPLYMAMKADNNGAGGTTLAKANIYYFKSEWEKVQ